MVDLRKAARLAALLLLPTLTSGVARAQSSATVLPPRLAELTGARALSMGDAFRAVGSGNETIFLNPAGLFAAQRYSIEMQGGGDFGSPGYMFGASISDSQAGPVAAGLSYQRFVSGPPGNRISANAYHLALAANVGEILSIGVGGKFLTLREATLRNLATPDVGLLVRLDALSFGVVGSNLINVRSIEAPRTLAFGASYGNEGVGRLSVDTLLDFDTRPEVSFKLNVGGEYVLQQLFAVRAGYILDRVRQAHFVSGGVGAFLPQGIGFDIGYRHQIGGDLPARQLLGNVKYQF